MVAIIVTIAFPFIIALTITIEMAYLRVTSLAVIHLQCSDILLLGGNRLAASATVSVSSPLEKTFFNECQVH